MTYLHECAAELTPSLTALFNMSMSTCALPDAWKHAYVVPIYKKGDKCKVDNYRPILLLNGISKIMERLVFNHVHHSVYPMINYDKQDYGLRHTDRHYFS